MLAELDEFSQNLETITGLGGTRVTRRDHVRLIQELAMRYISKLFEDLGGSLCRQDQLIFRHVIIESHAEIGAIFTNWPSQGQTESDAVQAWVRESRESPKLDRSAWERHVVLLCERMHGRCVLVAEALGRGVRCVQRCGNSYRITDNIL